jgi:hypothetical protein
MDYINGQVIFILVENFKSDKTKPEQVDQGLNAEIEEPLPSTHLPLLN